jgi:hypothetical protein
MGPRFIILMIITAFVPFLCASSSISDASAAVRDSNYETGSCSGDKYDKKGQTCCWREKVPGKLLAITYCQTCNIYKNSKGTYEQCTSPTQQALKLPTDTSGPSGQILEQTTALPNLSQGAGQNLGGLLGLANENNLTFSQANITSDSSSNDINNSMQAAQSNPEP